MEQIIIGGFNDALNNAATEYNALQSGYNWSASYLTKQVIPTAGALSNLQVELSASPAESGRTYTITLYVNGSPSALAVTITGDSATTGVDTDSVDVVAGDYIYLESTYSSPAPSNTPTVRWSCKFTGVTANESILMGNAAGDASATQYGVLQGAGGSSAAVETNTLEIIPTAGSIKKLYVILSTDPGTDPDDYYIRLRVSGADSDDGEGNPLSVTITADDTTGNDTTHTIPVTAGLDVSMAIVPENTPSAYPIVYWGVVFVATTDGESLILGSTSDASLWLQTEYNYLSPGGLTTVWSSTESWNGGQAHASNAVLKNLYMEISNAAGTGNTWTYTIRGGGGSTSLVVVFTGNAQKTGNDTAHTYIMADYDDLAIMAVPDSDPSTNKTSWGLVCYIVPAVEGWTNIAKVSGVASASIAKMNGVVVASIAKVNGVAV